MIEAPIVVKVGGSLFDLPDLGPRLEAWLKTLRGRDVILIAGGGAAADVVREMDRIHQLGEEKSHWLALRSLSVMAHLLVAVTPAQHQVPLFRGGSQTRAGPRPAAQRLDDAAQVAVLDLYAFARADEGRPGCLPHRWEVTSDSLAARAALFLGAPELILLKSVTIPPKMDWTEASRHGFVDGFFPTMIARGVKARAVNLREWRP